MLFTIQNNVAASERLWKQEVALEQTQREFNLEINQKEFVLSSYQDSLSNALKTNETFLVTEYEILELENLRKEAELKAIEDSIRMQDALLKAEQQEKLKLEERQEKFQIAAVAGILVGVLLLWMVITLFQRGRERKRHNKDLQFEKEKSERLLLSILPQNIADELKISEKVSPVEHPNVSIMFTDFQGFTSIAAEMTPKELLEHLEYAFEYFDKIIEKYGLEKIKTIGDAYMAVAGLTKNDPYHGINCVAAAIEMQDFMGRWNLQQQREGKKMWKLRIGVHSGSVVAGVIGNKKFAYDIWGDAVNVASRMETAGAAGKVNISEATYKEVMTYVSVEPKRTVPVKNRGEVGMYFVKQITAVRTNAVEQA